VSRLWPVVLPELRQFSASERERALRAARHTTLDWLELLGMAAALVLVTALTRYSVPAGMVSTRLGLGLLNFAVAIPLLGVALAPFHLRRLRRGLREQLAQQARQ
jgi:hypothetical protein